MPTPKLDDLRRALVREVEGPLKLVIKGMRYLLLRREDNLKEVQLPKLEKALKLELISGLRPWA